MKQKYRKNLKMFFEKIEDIPEIVKKVGCVVLVVPRETEVSLESALVLRPESKTTITIAQVQEMLNTLTTKQLVDRFVLIRPAELLGEEAANAILKALEEPQEKVHFVLVTSNPSELLPTILSRAVLYTWRGGFSAITEINADDKTKALAKRLLVAKPTELVELAETLTKKKDGVRESVLLVLGVTIEMAYKSYLITKKPVFLEKIPKFVQAYENIAANGHIKLHLVADLI